MDEIVTRLATMDDYDDLCCLYRQLDEHHVQLLPGIFQTFPGPSRSEDIVRKFIENEDADYILAELAGKVVGFIHIYKAEHPPYPMYKRHPYAMIGNVIVDKDYRRAGVGNLLFEEAQRWAAQQRLQFIQATVFAKNRGSVRFFEQRGFTALSMRFELALDQEITE